MVSAISQSMAKNGFVCASLAVFVTNAVIMAIMRHSSGFINRGLMKIQVCIILRTMMGKVLMNVAGTSTQCQRRHESDHRNLGVLHELTQRISVCQLRRHNSIYVLDKLYEFTAARSIWAQVGASVGN